MRALEQQGEVWGDGDQQWRFCANAARDACNWLIPADSTDAYCTACSHNHVVPDLSDPANLVRWRVFYYS